MHVRDPTKNASPKKQLWSDIETPGIGGNDGKKGSWPAKVKSVTGTARIGGNNGKKQLWSDIVKAGTGTPGIGGNDGKNGNGKQIAQGSGDDKTLSLDDLLARVKKLQADILVEREWRRAELESQQAALTELQVSSQELDVITRELEKDFENLRCQLDSMAPLLRVVVSFIPPCLRYLLDLARIKVLKHVSSPSWEDLFADRTVEEPSCHLFNELANVPGHPSVSALQLLSTPQEIRGAVMSRGVYDNLNPAYLKQIFEFVFGYPIQIVLDEVKELEQDIDLRNTATNFIPLAAIHNYHNLIFPARVVGQISALLDSPNGRPSSTLSLEHDQDARVEPLNRHLRLPWASGLSLVELGSAKCKIVVGSKLMLHQMHSPIPQGAIQKWKYVPLISRDIGRAKKLAKKYGIKKWYGIGADTRVEACKFETSLDTPSRWEAVGYWGVLGPAPGGDDAFTNKSDNRCNPSILVDRRHLVLRGETASNVLRLHAALLCAFRLMDVEHDVIEVTPPRLAQTQVEGGATLFKFDYYKSFRAENSYTRRHLNAYMRLEVELAFIDFDDLMTHIEIVIGEPVDQVLIDPATVARRRRGNTIKDAGGEPVMVPHTIGDDITEAAARQMTNIIGQPIFLKCRGRKARLGFVHRQWRFAHAEHWRDHEVVDGPKLLGAYGREGIDPEPCWYTDKHVDIRHMPTRLDTV
ncbi:hypothetical protein EDC04DRAFT_3086294 [Pisolithus marmoratus]|nr:hypothetical protein EDC04DRAFT_3086294 [Pisolithus marmoratus]